MNKIFKYPRTNHIQGSRFQPGDEDLKQINLKHLYNKFIVVEEKVDGSNTAISFKKGELLLQSRGHYLTGGDHGHFNLFKDWANYFKYDLEALLKDKYIIFGEWLYAKHTIFYDSLPHYFLEFDIYDKEKNIFLSTPERKRILSCSEIIISVPILFSGKIETKKELTNLICKSRFISKKRIENLIEASLRTDIENVFLETENSDKMEGLYIKVEDDKQVKERFKFIRNDFNTQIVNSDTYWKNKKLIANKLKDGVSLFNNPYNAI